MRHHGREGNRYRSTTRADLHDPRAIGSRAESTRYPFNEQFSLRARHEHCVIDRERQAHERFHAGEICDRLAPQPPFDQGIEGGQYAGRHFVQYAGVEGGAIQFDQVAKQERGIEFRRLDPAVPQCGSATRHQIAQPWRGHVRWQPVPPPRAGQLDPPRATRR